MSSTTIQIATSQPQNPTASRGKSRNESARELRAAALAILHREGRFMVSDLYGPSLGWGAKELSMCLCPLRPSTRDWEAVTGKDWMLQLAANQTLTQPPDPGRRLRESVRLSFLLLRGDQGPLSGAVA